MEDSLSPDDISAAKRTQVSSNEVCECIHLWHIAIVDSPTSTSSPEISRAERSIRVAGVSGSTGGKSLAQKVKDLSATTSEGEATGGVGSGEAVQVTDSTTATSRRGRSRTTVLEELSSSPSPVAVVAELNRINFMAFN